jgi:glycosyltransferase involved in cell wall biosynthesis
METKSGSPSHRPRIGIDLHVVDGIFQGSRTHCLELFSRVVALCPEFDFVLLAGQPKKLLSFSDHFALPHVTIRPMPEKPAPVRLLWQLPQIARSCRLSLLHTQYIAPPLPFCATAVTVHDILFESHPQYFERSFVMRSRLLVPFSVRRSAAIFAVSEFSRKQICETYSIPMKRVHTIPNGVDRVRFSPGNAGRDEVRALGLKSGNYFLSVGRLEPRKNHATLLRAWAQLPQPRPCLVIVGQRHFQYKEAFEVIHALHLESDVVLLEEVSDVQLPAVYRHAKGFIYCSWAEGFGMPVLEAMSSGVPVISSSNTALSEVCAAAALGIDPRNLNEIADAVRSVDQEAELRQDLIRRGFERAAQFTWDRSAQIVRNVYREYFGLLPPAPAA